MGKEQWKFLDYNDLLQQFYFTLRRMLGSKIFSCLNLNSSSIMLSSMELEIPLLLEEPGTALKQFDTIQLEDIDQKNNGDQLNQLYAALVQNH